MESHQTSRGGGVWTSGAILALALLFLPLSAGAVTKNWIGDSGMWSGSSNWNPPGQPQEGDEVRLVQNDSRNRVVSYDNTLYPEARLQGLTIDARGSGEMILLLLPGQQPQQIYPLYADYAIVGELGRQGILSHAGGEAYFNLLIIGDRPGSRGQYYLYGGLLKAGIEVIGNSGTGIFEQSGGGNDYSWLLLGAETGSYGRYTLSGGTLSGHHGARIGINGVGEFVQTGGVHNITEYLNVGNGTYDQRGGKPIPVI